MLLCRQQIGVRAAQIVKLVGHLPPPLPQSPLQGYQNCPCSVHLPELLVRENKVHSLPPGLRYEWNPGENQQPLYLQLKILPTPLLAGLRHAQKIVAQ